MSKIFLWSIPRLLRQDTGVTRDVGIEVNVVQVDINFIEQTFGYLLLRVQHFLEPIDLNSRKTQLIISSRRKPATCFAQDILVTSPKSNGLSDI